MKVMLAALALSPLLGGCDREAPGISGHIETIPERIKRQEAEFNASPDIKGPALLAGLRSSGVRDAWMHKALDDDGVEIIQLRVPAADFGKLDHRALAKLMLDSRYRFEFVDKDQAHVAALYHGAELNAREEATALRQLKERGQLDSYPKYRAGMAVTAFAPQLEAWCGYQRGQAFRIVDGNWIDYAHPMVDLAVVDKDGRASASFDCVKRVVDATPDLRHRFIGNRGREGAIDY
jgi:hypothetical protein